jgi:flagellar FliL protein
MATSATNQAKTAPRVPAKGHASSGTDAAPDAAAPKKKGKLLIIILALLLLAGAGGAAAWYFLRDHDAGAAKPGSEHATAAKAAAAKPVFVTLEPFTVNLQHEDSSAQYLQVGLALKMTDATLTDSIKLHMPEIRSRVLLLLSSKKASEIASSEGKKALIADLTREITQPLGTSAQTGALEGVLFTSFVIQ